MELVKVMRIVLVGYRICNFDHEEFKGLAEVDVMLVSKCGRFDMGAYNCVLIASYSFEKPAPPVPWVLRSWISLMSSSCFFVIPSTFSHVI